VELDDEPIILEVKLADPDLKDPLKACKTESEEVEDAPFFN